MAETFASAVENAARLLCNRENGLRATYGNANSDALPLAVAWTDLARVISDHESHDLSTGENDE